MRAEIDSDHSLTTVSYAVYDDPAPTHGIASLVSAGWPEDRKAPAIGFLAKPAPPPLPKKTKKPKKKGY